MNSFYKLYDRYQPTRVYKTQENLHISIGKFSYKLTELNNTKIICN